MNRVQSPVQSWGLPSGGPAWRGNRSWAIAAYVYASIVALGLAYFIAGAPLQVSDGVGNMLQVQRTDFSSLLWSQFTARGFLRPLLWAQIDLTFELANGRYLAMYKTIHALELLAAGWLFVSLLRVRTIVATLAVPFGIAILFGSHTFAGTIVEAFPINTFLTIIVCCLLGATLSFGAPALWRDVAAVALFVFAVLTVETGLLVWVGFVAAWFVGARGVSGRAILAATVLLAGYFFLRFGPLNVGAPGLVERSSGFGFRTLDPPELIARFGDRPYLFYAYNVASQILTVLFAEPKGGVWSFTRDLLADRLRPGQMIAVATAAGTTVLIGWYAFSRISDWRRRSFSHGDRLLAVFVAILGANAVISYPYTKDVIVSPAGAFYALAATVALVEALSRLGARGGLRPMVLATSLVLAALSAGWAVRLVGMHYNLRDKAFITRNDWMDIYTHNRLLIGQLDLETDAEAAALIKQLYEQAVTMRTPSPYFADPRAARYFEAGW